MNEDYKCKFCGTGRPPTETLDDIGEKYLFCSVCKEVITNSVKEQEVDVNMTYYYDSEKNHVIVEMEDWEKILKILKATGAEVILPVSETEELE